MGGVGRVVDYWCFVLIINLLPVLRMTQDGTRLARRPFYLFIFGLEDRRTSERGRRANFDETVEIIVHEKEILCLNPADRRGKLVSQQLGENHIASC